MWLKHKLDHLGQLSKGKANSFNLPSFKTNYLLTLNPTPSKSRFNKPILLFRVFELLWLLLATAAALFMFQNAKETSEENEHLRAELRRKHKAHKNSDSEGSGCCSVCLIEKVEVIIQPCGHACICRDCANILMQNVERKCPICRHSIKKIQNVYLS